MKNVPIRNTSPYLNTRELIAHLRCSRTRLWELISRGLPRLRLGGPGGRLLFDLKQVDEWLAQNFAEGDWQPEVQPPRKRRRRGSSIANSQANKQ